MLAAGCATCCLQEEALSGDWVRALGKGYLCAVTHVLLAGTNHWGTAGQLFVAADRYRQTPALCVQAVRKDLNLTLSLVCHQEE